MITDVIRASARPMGLSEEHGTISEVLLCPVVLDKINSALPH